MKRGLTFCLLMLAAAAAPALAEQERILSYDTTITVREDGLVMVNETIEVRAEGRQIKRGIYRDIPTVYRGPWLTRKTVRLVARQVLRDGRGEPYHVEGYRNGERVYIGHEDIHLRPGTYTYNIVYSLDRQLGFFEDHDELYFNAIGTGWEFDIEQGSATVILPESVPRDGLKLKAYVGRWGARGTSYTARVDEDGHAAFTLTRSLSPKEGLTVVVGWPKGYVEEPTDSDKAAYFVRDNLGTIVGLLGLSVVLAYYGGAWVAVGRDPAKGLIIPLFEPPKGFSPAGVRCLWRMGYDAKCLTTAVINMAVKGYLTIEEEDDEYTLAKTGADKSALAPEEKKVATALLGRRDKITLEQDEHKRVKKAIEALKKALALSLHKRFFSSNRAYVIPAVVGSGLVLLAAGLLSPSGAPVPFGFICLWLTIWSMGVGALLFAVAARWRAALAGGRMSASALGSALTLSLLAVPFVGGEVLGLSFLVMASSVWMIPLVTLAAAMNLLFYYLMKAPTQGGRRVMDQIEGFRMYLAAAEQDRLNYIHTPERTPELFEKYLPYALALDVENRWAEQFSDVLSRAAAGEQYAPSWYVGASFATLGAAGFASSMGSSFSGAIASASTAPGSSSGFGGGGGGGGAGGGGGGGGGGGW